MKIKIEKIKDNSYYCDIPWNLPDYELKDLTKSLENKGYNPLKLSQGHLNHDKPFGKLAVSRIYLSK